MKRVWIVLTGYFALSMTVLSMMLTKQLTLHDFTDVLFLHMASFPNLSLNKPNFQFTIFFLFLFSLILLFAMNSVSESVSFISMVAYRQGKAKTIRQRALYYVRKLSAFYVIAAVSILGLYCILESLYIYVELLPDVFRLLMYLLRYFLVLFTFLFLYEIGSMTGKGGSGYFLLDGIYIGLVLIDIMVETSMVTVAGSLSAEGICLAVTAVMSATLCLFGYQYYLKKGDIL